jgi:flagellar P-ring protein precursor FlgI
MLKKVFKLIVFVMLFSSHAVSQESRIKDLVNLRGNRSNQVMGIGLVVGLAATGDSPSSLVTAKAVKNFISKMGFLTGNNAINSQSIAAVVVTADLPAFMKNGDKIDVKISSLGDAKSLAGGTLLSTELRAGDDRTYVVAQGSVVVGQADGSGPRVLTVATVPGGGTVEREFIPELAVDGVIHLSLKNPDFTTNARIVEKINTKFRGVFALSRDPSRIEVKVPPSYADNLVGFIADLEGLRVLYDQKAVVVLNERTGTVVIGSDVAINRISISHGDLNITIGEGKKSKGESVVDVKGTTVGDLVSRLNALGVKPADLVGIFQTLHASGALNADLKFL